MIDCAIVGGGQSALATAYYLHKQGIEPVIFDDQSGPGAAWRHVWPSMTLFSTADFSNLPGMMMPSHAGFPPASHVVDYFARYEKRYGFDIRRPVTVSKVTHDGEHFTLHLSDGTEYPARTVVAATGTWSSPFIPFYPGTFSGTQWHSANYPGVQEFQGQKVAVVGGANSGAQIAAELALDEGVDELTWYTRTPPRWMPDDVDGRVLFKRNRERALAILKGDPDPGADEELGDIVMLPQVRQARDSGVLEAQEMFKSLDELRADHLIWCTGFRPALGPFRNILNKRPPGLELVGYGDWLSPGAATIVGVSPVAKATAKAIAEVLS